MIEKSAVLFDLDGTLLNTLTDLFLSVNYSLEKNLLPKRSLDEVRHFLGNGIQRLIADSVPEGTSEIIEKLTFNTFVDYYGKHCADNTSPFDKIPELLKELRSNNVKIAIVSNKADFAAQKLCEQFFPDMYDFAIGAKDNLKKKPASDMINAALVGLGNLKRSECVYVGDSEVDIMTAKNADMPCINVSWGFRTRSELLEAGAKIIVDNPLEILDIVKEE